MLYAADAWPTKYYLAPHLVLLFLRVRPLVPLQQSPCRASSENISYGCDPQVLLGMF